jgi:tRNA(Arg) A34 adenosine deaminase TadA
MQTHPIHIDLPDWLESFLAERPSIYADDCERMRLAVDLSAENLRADTGGPFGAAVFESDSGRLISVGVNRVMPSHCCIAHAEMVAIACAQQRLGQYDLRMAAPARFQLFSSTEPCAMCMGAVPWSGVERLVCAARDTDARAIGFDEGHKPADWVEGYIRRGIQVTRDLLRAEAVAVLQRYAAGGGAIYGPGAVSPASRAG